MNFVSVQNGDVTLRVAVAGEGPVIVCVHGWPELWYSWRHQVQYFSKRGFKVAALDVRGYGGSSKPHEIAAYSMKNLTADVAAVIDYFGGKAVLFGHDWGAPIVWNTALRHPEKVRAVAGLSVPYFPRGEMSPIALYKALYADRFFYQLYFQAEGVAEAELEADVGASLRKFYYAGSGNAPQSQLTEPKPANAKFLDGMVDPKPFPSWLTDADLAVYIEAYQKGGFRGPLNRYRAQEIDFAESAHLAGKPVTQPSYFVGGERDLVRYFVPGVDLYAQAGAACSDFRGALIIPGAGHWVQQEAPDATNVALEGFLKGL